jgi:mono/diheme cytochrome c family protein
LIRKIRELAFLFLLFGGSSTALAHHELANRNLSNGQKNYQSFCASCHDANLEGQPNWRAFKKMGACRHHRMMNLGILGIMIRKCYLIIQNLGGQATFEAVGVNNYLSGMPAFEELLSDVEIWEILSYIRSTWPEHIQEAHATKHPIKNED